MFQERHSTLEKKYLKTLNNYSDRLRLAAAMQAEVLPLKVGIQQIIDYHGIN